MKAKEKQHSFNDWLCSIKKNHKHSHNLTRMILLALGMFIIKGIPPMSCRRSQTGRRYMNWLSLRALNPSSLTKRRGTRRGKRAFRAGVSLIRLRPSDGRNYFSRKVVVCLQKKVPLRVTKTAPACVASWMWSDMFRPLTSPAALTPSSFSI